MADSRTTITGEETGFRGCNDVFNLMDRKLFKAACSGNVSILSGLLTKDPDILFSATPHGNNVLHIAAMLGHEEFARKVCNDHETASSLLLSCTNINNETPLIAALMAPNAQLASFLISTWLETNVVRDIEAGAAADEMMLTVDRLGENALHHALRNGFEDIGFRLLDAEPQLAQQVSKRGESPLHMACRRGYFKVVKRLIQIPSSSYDGPGGESALNAAIIQIPFSSYDGPGGESALNAAIIQIPSSSYDGPGGESALNAAIMSGNIDIVKELLKWRPDLFYIKDSRGYAALSTAVLSEKLEIVKILLEYDPHQAYIRNEHTNETPFLQAARRGFALIAEEIRRHCPDSVYFTRRNGYNALHDAIEYERPEFIDYILRTPPLHRLINQGDINGELPIHCAAKNCDPKALQRLISHRAQDYSAVNSRGLNSLRIIYEKSNLYKTIKWNEAVTLLWKVIPISYTISMVSDKATKEFSQKDEKQIKELTQRSISNTSFVAALLATITFAAAFTLPGGYSSDSPGTGLPIFARKAAFKAFLISDTLAMCSSLAVAFLCILATWEDLDYLRTYMRSTRALMWCAYMATTVAFGTGLFTVIAPTNLWLAILILILIALLPIISKLIGEWPTMFKFRLRL